ncbi:unnamed protein product [Caenorhabditis auriculariae]|uniref:G-protein coupled receptors family 1 profile domain-containing protein n=1 Tax=Caenorhabditis auriculariae TaxID=2777116 RepID=A0A8S1HGG7_9PELO|nr:unnamed protein product [Caenorhabditis auriculariae]
MDVTKVVFVSAHTILSLAGIFFNGLLIYVGIFHSPNKIKTYAALILNFAFSDLIICLMNLFIQQRLVTTGDSTIFVSNGPCKLFGPSVCFQANNVQQHLITFGAYSLLLSFFYRYYIILRVPPSRRNVLIVLFIFYLPSFIQYILSLFMESPPEEMRQIFEEAFPQYNSKCLTIGGIKDNTLWLPNLVISHGIFAVIPIYVAIFVFRYMIMRKLKVVMCVRSETRSMQKQFLKALTYQTSIPMISLVAMIFFGIGQQKMFKHPAMEYATPICLLLTPVVSPLASLYFVHPYKTKVQSLMGQEANSFSQKTAIVSISQTSNV